MPRAALLPFRRKKVVVNAIFEIHPARIAADEGGTKLPWHDAQVPDQIPPYRLSAGDGLVWLKFDTASGTLSKTTHVHEASLGLKVVGRKLGAELALLPRREGMLVNGLPALPLNVVGAKDSIVPAPGWIAYVTERVKPHVGAPDPEHVGMKCPFCRIPVTVETRIVTCRCGAPYHHETSESHPHVAEKDRLVCFTKVRTCLSCTRPLSLAEHLVWDPATLGGLT
jgi:hypothetical protein